MAYFERPKFISLLYLATSISQIGSYVAYRPKIDPGVFVIHGVSTCGSGSGYCVLGASCTVDSDFEAFHDKTHHCRGLRHAFQPTVSFECCQLRLTTAAELATTSSTTQPAVAEAAELSETPIYNIQSTTETNQHHHQDAMTQIGNVAANTNRILEAMSKKSPPKSASKIGPVSKNSPTEDPFSDDSTEKPEFVDFEFFENDKSLINLLLQALNESLRLDADAQN